MKKKVMMLLAAMMLSVASYGQFEQKKVYVGASLSGLSMKYNGSEKGSFGLDLKGGYMFVDNLMALAQLSYFKQNDVPYTMSLGVGARYYIIQNGLYLGAGVQYKHRTGYNDFLPGIQVGYAFFLSRTVTIEPEIYYDQSFKNHGDYSTIGLRVGVGVYLFKD